MIVTVDLGERAYDVVLEEGARHHLASVLARLAPRSQSIAIITSSNLACQPWFDFDSGRTQHVITVPEGELAKTLASYEVLLEQLAEELPHRARIVGRGRAPAYD